MPEGNDVKVMILYAVVNEVPHPGEIETPDILLPSVLNSRSYARLFDQAFERCLEIPTYGVWCC